MGLNVESERRDVYRHGDLVRLLDPRSVAVVGASPRAGSFGKRVADNLEHFSGALHLVNPRYTEIDGRVCHPSLAALPEVPDCIIVALPAEAVEETVSEAVRLGIGGVVVFASGYAETGTPENIARQQRLTDLVKGTKTRLIGPNCIGAINYRSNARLSFSPMPSLITPLPASIGIISQSGAMGMAAAQAVEHGASVLYTLTAGNSCDVDPSDLIAFLAEEPGCKAIACIFEGLTDVDRFMAASEIAWNAGKPVIIYKMATGTRGAEAALSHTGALAGADAAYRAAFEKTGTIQVDGIEDLVETALFFAKAPALPLANGVGILSTTGGGAVVGADKAEQHGVHLPHFRPETEQELARHIPDFGSPRNPCDLTAQVLNDPDGLRKCGEAVFAEPSVSAVILPHPLATASSSERFPMLGDIGLKYGKPLCIVWLPGWLEGPGAREADQYHNASLFRSMDRCMAAIAQWHWRGEKLKAARETARLTPDDVRDAVAAGLAAQPDRVVGETEAKSMLARYGVPVPAERLAGTIDEMRAAIAEIGLPVVMKIESPDIPHKTEAGMVKLGLDTEAAAAGAYRDIMDRAAAMPDKPRVAGVVIQPMIPQGLELVIGGRIDPLFGPIVVVGFGGVLIELLKDSVSALAPVSPAEARALLPRLRGFALLNGYRGSAAVDLDALANIIAGVSEFLADHAGSIAELDINPLIATEHGLIAVDALIVRA